MPSKYSLLLGAAASCALLASCGGSSETPTPSPTPTSTAPTPTPTETPEPVNFDFTEEFAFTTVRLYVYAYFTPNSGGSETWSDGRVISGLSGIAYEMDPELVSYRFIADEDPVQFGGDELESASSTERIYANSEGRLILEVPFDHVLRANYQRTDPFIDETVPGTLRSRRVSLFANPITTEDDIDSILTYDGLPVVVGGSPGTTPSNAVSAPAATFTVDPDGDEDGPLLTGTIPIFETVNGVQTQRANLSFSATLAETGAFGGNIADSASGFEGAFAGTLAGPNREEMTFVFRVTHDDGRKYLGNFIGN